MAEYDSYGHYDEAYKAVRHFFGSKPDGLLTKFGDQVPKDLPVLDVGAGQGRNALPLAREGVTVHAIDPSQVAVDTLARLAREENLPIESFCSSFEDFEAPGAPYGAVLLFGLIPMLPRESIAILDAHVRAWTCEGSLLFATAFTDASPGIEKIASRCTLVGPGSYADGEGAFRTFLGAGEILEVFPGYEVLLHDESMGAIHRHGDGPEEQHHCAAVVLTRR